MSSQPLKSARMWQHQASTTVRQQDHVTCIYLGRGVPSERARPSRRLPAAPWVELLGFVLILGVAAAMGL